MTWIIVPLLAATGLFLSGFFSGLETGFYRATRLRLVLDALAGDRVSRGLLWLSNHPSMFVATTLVGNNLANYMASLAIVMGTQALISGHGHAAELIAPLALAPVLFVYGELLPKYLFMQAPNRLLRRGGPLFLMFVVLFYPVSVLLWGMNKILQRLAGASPEQVKLTLARRELQRVLDEGHEAGILHPAQRRLAQGIFAVAKSPLGRFATPLARLPRARSDMTKNEILQLARRYRVSVVPVELSATAKELLGYVRVIDLGLRDDDAIGPVRPFLDLPHDMPHVAALMRMESAEETLAQVVDSEGKTLGIVTADQLRAPLF